MTYGIPDSAGIQLDELKAIVAAVEPTKSHAALRRSLVDRWPSFAWRVAAPVDEFSMAGGVVDGDGARIADSPAAWLQERIDEAGGDYLAVWRRYKGDAAFQRTEFRGATRWAVAPLGDGVTDYVQLEIDEVQEAAIGPIISDAAWRRPDSEEDLIRESPSRSGDAKLIGGPQYRFRRAIHVASFLAEMTAIEQRRRTAFVAANVFHTQPGRPGTIAVATTHRVPRGTALPPGYEEVEMTDLDPNYLTRELPLQRFYTDWAASSAGRFGNRLFDHWTVSFVDYDDGRGRQLRGTPRWLAEGTLPQIELVSGETAFALMDRLQRFDERVGCAFGWYFFMLHGNRGDRRADRRGGRGRGHRLAGLGSRNSAALEAGTLWLLRDVRHEQA